MRHLTTITGITINWYKQGYQLNAHKAIFFNRNNQRHQRKSRNFVKT